MLEVEGITVRFGGHVALDDVSMTAQAGAITGLIGPNGAGKTTLFNVITGLGVSRVGGHVRLDGNDISDLPPHKRARLGLARTFQQLQLFGTLTVTENIRMAANRKGTESPTACADRLMSMLGITHLSEVLAHNVPTGQARLVELARALATQPKLLLLDEPASGQDARETAHFEMLLRRIADDGVGILLVEHDIELVMGVCSVINVLDFGMLIACGPPDAVRNDPKVLSAYLGTDEVVG